MEKQEIDAMFKYINDNCFLEPMPLFTLIVEKSKLAKLTDQECMTIFQWIYADMQKLGENSFFHKNKVRQASEAFYICELINMFLIARDQFNLFE